MYIEEKPKAGFYGLFFDFFLVTPKRRDLWCAFLRKRIFVNTGPTPSLFAVSRSQPWPNADKHFRSLGADTPNSRPDNAAVSSFSQQVGISWFWHKNRYTLSRKIDTFRFCWFDLIGFWTENPRDRLRALKRTRIWGGEVKCRLPSSVELPWTIYQQRREETPIDIHKSEVNGDESDVYFKSCTLIFTY